jgi:hypothetical protein
MSVAMETTLLRIQLNNSDMARNSPYIALLRDDKYISNTRYELFCRFNASHQKVTLIGALLELTNLFPTMEIVSSAIV